MFHVPPAQIISAEAVPEPLDLAGLHALAHPETAECCPKDPTPVLPEGYAQNGPDRSFYGKGAVTEPPRQRRRPADVPWFQKEMVDGYRVTRSITKAQRDTIIAAWDRAAVFGMPLNTHLIHRDPALDAMEPLERMKSWDRIVQKVRSHCAWRKRTTRLPFPCAFILVRESDRDTHEGEHGHILVHAPNPDEAELFQRVAAGWSENTLGQDADDIERIDGGKIVSAVSYLTKASPQAVRADASMFYRRSGAVVGPRFKITGNLTNAAAVEAAEQRVGTRQRIRSERAMIARRSEARAGQRRDGGFSPMG